MSTDGQGTKCRRNIAENLNRLSRVHERYRRQTDRQTTDGRAIAYSEREREFTFANQEKTHQTLQIIAPLLLPAVFARLWNVWSITGLSGTWKETKLSLAHRVVSAKVEVPQTSLYAWNLSSGRLLFRSNMLPLSSLI